MPPASRPKPVTKQKPALWKELWSFLRKNIPNPSELYALIWELALSPSRPLTVMVLLIALELIVNFVVVWKVPYTEIDWKAYMQEVEGFWNGTTDYSQLKGDTGPLVYPAGFVYIFLGLYHLTSKGENILLAQCIFAAIYVIFIMTVFRIYHKSKSIPPYAFVFMCCTSYRIHSLFALRLFNDPVAMLLFYVSLNLFLDDHWTLGCAVYSLAVSVKMNVLLFCPALALVLLNKTGWRRTILLISLCGLIQALLGFPFLLSNPEAYIINSFDLGRQFFYKWTVNWRCVPEWLFLDRKFHLVLLTAHLGSLLLFAHFRWTASPLLPHNGGLFQFLLNPKKMILSHNQVISMLFTSNLIGVMFSRSLHYQFYVWYFHTLYFLLWESVHVYSGLRLLLLGLVELSWNTYPSTVFSSNLLHLSHGVMLFLIYRRGRESQQPTQLCQHHYHEVESKIRESVEQSIDKKLQ